MKKSIYLIAIGTMIAFGLSSCNPKKSQNDSEKQKAKTESCEMKKKDAKTKECCDSAACEKEGKCVEKKDCSSAKKAKAEK